MAQRNPMNDRYTGDGPEGKTRKSASKLKPKTEAASSVYIEKKPQTKQERKAARKKRERQEAAKEAERQRKREEREKQERIAAGEVIEEPKKAGFLSQAKNIFFPRSSEQHQMQPKAESGSASKPTASSQSKAPAQQAGNKSRNPNTPEYRKLKRIYWVLMGIGVAAIALSLLINFQLPQLMDGMGMMIPMGVAYVAVIGAIILDYTKIRKLQRAHMSVDGGKKSPKQLKHEQEQAAAAQLLEEQRKAQRELKRANSKNPFVKRSRSAEGEDESEDEGVDVAEDVAAGDDSAVDTDDSSADMDTSSADAGVNSTNAGTRSAKKRSKTRKESERKS